MTSRIRTAQDPRFSFLSLLQRGRKKRNERVRRQQRQELERLEDRALLTADVFGQVWHDVDGDGINEPADGEFGVEFAAVELISTGVDGNQDTADDVSLGTVVTDGDGNYSFNGVTAGEYFLQIRTPAAYSVTTMDAGTDDTIDSDFDAVTGQTASIDILDFSTNFVDGGLADGPQDYGWGFHLFDEFAPTGIAELAVDVDENIFVAGRNPGTVDLDHGPGVREEVGGSNNFFIAKYTPAGAMIWGHGIGDQVMITGMETDSLGNVFVTGSYSSAVADFDPDPVGVLNPTHVDGDDAFVLRLNADGELDWLYTYADVGDQTFESLAIDSFDNVIVGGSDNGTAIVQSIDGIIGVDIWTWQTAGGLAGSVNGIAVDGIDDIYLTGEYSGTVDFDPLGFGDVLSGPAAPDYNIFVTKLDAIGSYFGTFDFDVAGDANFEDLVADSAGNFYLGGWFNGTIDLAGAFNATSTGGDNPLVVALDTDGFYRWHSHLEAGDSRGYDLATTLDETTVYMTGRLNDSVDHDPGARDVTINVTDPDAFVHQYLEDGTFVDAFAYQGNDTDYGMEIAVNGLNEVLVVGEIEGELDVDPSPNVDNLLATDNGVFVTKLNEIVTGPVVIFGDSDDEDILIKLHDADSRYIEVTITNKNDPADQIVEVHLWSAVTTLVVDSDIGLDSFTVDFVNGNPIPADGLSLISLDNEDDLTIENGTVGTVTYTLESFFGGEIDIDGSLIFHDFTEQEDVTDTLVANNRTFALDDFDNEIVVGDTDISPTNGISQLQSLTDALPLISFDEPSDNLTIQTDAGFAPGADIVTLLILESDPQITIETGDGDDEVIFDYVEGSPLTAPGIFVDTGLGDDLISFLGNVGFIGRVTHNFNGPTEGDVVVDNVFTVDYINNEYILDLHGSDERVFNFDNSDNTIIAHDNEQHSDDIAALGLDEVLVSVIESMNSVPVEYDHAAFQTEIFSFDGDDQLIVDYADGLALPESPTRWEAGTDAGNGDSMILQNGSMPMVDHVFTNDNDGNVTITGDFDDDNDPLTPPIAFVMPLDYVGLEPIYDDLDVVDRTFTYLTEVPDGVVSQSPLDATKTRIESSVNEIVDFVSATGSMTITLTAGDDIFSVDSVGTAFATPTNLIDALEGNDSLTFNQPTTDWTTEGRDGEDVLTLNLITTPPVNTNVVVDLTSTNIRYGGNESTISDFDFETLNIETGDGIDGFIVTPRPLTTINIDAHDPAEVPGDSLFFNGSGTNTMTDPATRSGFISSPGRRDVNYVDIEYTFIAKDVVDWEAEGGAPIINGQTENLADNPVTGSVITAVAHPTNPNILYAGTANGGVWRTGNATDPSPDWTPLTDFMDSNSIGALAIHPDNPGILVAGVGHHSSYGLRGGPFTGVMMTTDGGVTWTQHTNGLEDTNVSGIAVRGFGNTATILVSSNGWDGDAPGVFRSTDGGASFVKLSGLPDGPGTEDGSVLDLVEDPTNPNRFYVAVAQEGIFRTDDMGDTWVNVSESDDALATVFSNTFNFTIDMSVSPVDGRLYIAVGVQRIPFTILGDAIYIGHYNEGTGAWTAMDLPTTPADDGPHPGLGVFFNMSIVADPNVADRVYFGGDVQAGGNTLGGSAGTGRLFRGDATQLATGATPSPQWEHLTHSNSVAAIPDGGTANNTAPHGGSREMLFDAVGNLIETDDGGIYVRTSPEDNTGDWFSLNGNMQIAETHDVAYDTLSNIIIAGTQNTSVIQQVGSDDPVWDSLDINHGGDVQVDNITLAAQGQSIRYRSRNNLGNFRRDIYDADNNLISSTPVGLTGGGNLQPQFRTPVVLNSQNPNWMLIGGADGLWESFNQGENVSRISTDVIVNSTDGIPLVYGGRFGSFISDELIYAGVGDQLWVRFSIIGGFGDITPVDLNGDPAPPWGVGETIRGLLADPFDRDELFLITESSIWRTTDPSAAADPNNPIEWEQINGDLESLDAVDFRSMEYVFTEGVDGLLLGTGHGVFFARNDDYLDWDALGGGLPNVPVFELDYDPADDVLVAATMGRGVWSLPDVTSLIADTDPTVLGGLEDNDIIVRVVENSPSLIEVEIDGVVEHTYVLADLNSLSIFGLTGDDSLTVDYVNGNPIPVNGINWDGGDQNTVGDDLTLRNGKVDEVIHTLINTSDGSVELDGHIVNYVGLEPVYDYMDVVDRVFNFSDATDLVTLEDTGTDFDGITSISTASTSETVEFLNPTQTLTINGNGGNDDFTILHFEEKAFFGRDALTLDPSFGTFGVVEQPGDIYDIAQLPDGRIIAVGTDVGEEDLQLTRYLADGTLDTTFGTGGSVATDITAVSERDLGTAVELQEDGKIVVAGIGYDGPEFDFILARYEADGALDPTFGVGGLVVVDMSQLPLTEIHEMLIQPDGKILVAGNIQEAAGGVNFALVRYNADGSFDTAFGTNGVVTTDISGAQDRAHAMLLQPDGNIVLAGAADETSANSTIALARYDGVTGDLDVTFGAGGIVLTDVPGGPDVAYGIAIQPDDKLIVTGTVGVAPDNDIVVVRYNPDGSTDGAFGVGGIVVQDLGGQDEGYSTIMQPNGEILVAGRGDTSNTAVLARFGLDGAFESYAVFAFGSDQARHVEFTSPAGQILVAGHDYAGDGGFIARLDGSPILVDIAVAINGGEGNDTVIADFINGNPIPTGGLTYNGDGNEALGDDLVLRNGLVVNVTHSMLNPNAGSVEVDGRLLSYDGLEPVFDILVAQDRVFNFVGGLDDVARLTDDTISNNGINILVSEASSELIRFLNPINSMTINMEDGNDLLVIEETYDEAAPTAGPTNIPPVTLLFDDFPTTTFNSSNWSLVDGATIDDEGLNETSPTLSARLNSRPDGEDELRSTLFDLSQQAEAVLSYYVQRTGGGNSPDPGDDLIVEYLDTQGNWGELNRHLGDGEDETEYSQHIINLPYDALHPEFQFRFRALGDASTTTNLDDWFVDDVQLQASQGSIPVSPGTFPLTMTGGIGEDTFNIFPGTTVPMFVDGNDPTTAPGDTLIYKGPGLDSVIDPATRQGVVTQAGFQDVNYIDIEDVLIDDGTAQISGRIWDDLNGDGLQDDGNTTSVTSFSNTTVVPITDLVPVVVSSSVDVAGISGRLTDINVEIDIDHTQTSDLQVVLVAPDGTTIDLILSRGTGANFTGTILDDDAVNSITGADNPFTGSFIPEGDLDSLSGMSPNGTWTLFVTDTEFGDGGQINSFAVTITAVESGPGEPGIAGAVAELFTLGPDGIEHTFDDISHGTVITNDFGFYSFDGLFNGEYYVTFRPPVGYGFSPQDVGGDDTIDSDANMATGRSDLLLLDIGQIIDDLDSGLDGAAPEFGWAVGAGGNENVFNPLPEQGNAIATDSDGHVYVAGWFQGTAEFDSGPGSVTLSTAGGRDAFIAKYTFAGALVWVRRIGGGSTDYATGIAIDEDNNVVVTGNFSQTVDFDPTRAFDLATSVDGLDAFIVKLDADGNHLWNQQLGDVGDQILNDVTIDFAGNILVAGDNGTAESISAKYDPDGNLEWQEVFPLTPGVLVTTGIATDSLGNVYVSGWFESINLGQDVVVVYKRLSDGTLQTSRLFTGGRAFDVAVDSRDEIHITGGFIGTVDFDGIPLTSAGGEDIFVVEFDTDLLAQNAQSIGGTGDDRGEGIAIGYVDSVYLTGVFEDEVDLDGDLNPEWDAGGDSKAFILEIMEDGTFGIAEQQEGGGVAEGRAIALDPWGNVYVTGHFAGDVDFDPFAGTFTTPWQGGTDAFVWRLTTTATISGRKFHDINGDQIRQDNEEYLDGWLIRLLDEDGNPVLDPDGNPIEVITSSIDYDGDGVEPDTEVGIYEFRNVRPGDYIVQEVLLPNWGASLPLSAEYEVTVDARDEVTDLDFGNYVQSSIIGRKLNDRDGDGVYTAATDEWLNGWTIELENLRTGAIISTVTADIDLDGNGTIDPLTERGIYRFDNIAPSEYIVREINQTGWRMVNPVTGEHFVDIDSGTDIVDLDFANLVPIELYGGKWEDLNANGVRDAGEPWLNGWTIELLDLNGVVIATTQTGPLDLNGNNSFEPDEEGQYQFLGLDPGDYTIREVFPSADWGQSAPATGVYDLPGLLGGDVITSLDFGNYLFVTLSGRKWNDRNNNDIQDPAIGEDSLNGWTFELVDINGVVVDTQVTADIDLDGNGTIDPVTERGVYIFNNVIPGEYTVREVQQAGWRVSTPANGEYNFTVISGDVVEGLDMGNYVPIEIYGRKFHDLNANGILEAGEPGLNGWVIELYDGNGALVATTVTADIDRNNNGTIEADEVGLYEFLGLDPGDYEIVEVMQTDWLQSAPVSGTFVLPGTLGDDVYTDQDFGNYQYAFVNGRKWNDLDGNGIHDPAEEPYLNDWTIELVHPDGTVIDTTVTADFDANNDGVIDPLTEVGWYFFDDITPHPLPYTIREVGQTYWTFSNPTSGQYVEQLNSQEIFANADFGNEFHGATIEGRKYEDLNGNAVRDADEPWLNGWEITLYDENGLAIATAITADVDRDEDGTIDPETESAWFIFEELYPDTRYLVGETLQTDWYQSAPGTVDERHDIFAEPDGIYTADFGNYQYASITGRKWNDLNGDGVHDPATEEYLNGWTIELVDANDNVVKTSITSDIDLNNDGTIDPLTERGWYVIEEIIPGPYTLREVNQVHWIPSNPSTGEYSVLPLSNQDITSGLDFGNEFLNALIEGRKFEDLNADGTWDAGEPWLNGWEIVLYDDTGAVVATTVTADIDRNGDGTIDPATETAWYVFDQLTPGTYEVGETLQTDWEQSLPGNGNGRHTVVGEEDGIHRADFGNFRPSDISGRKFNDRNADAVRDAGEEYLNGWDIILVDSDGNELQRQATHDIDLNGDGTIDPETESGWYLFEDLRPGQYVILEQNLNNWRQTRPFPPDYPVDLISGVDVTGLDFGNFELAQVSGRKYHDRNANGIREAGEEYLNGWDIELVDADGNVIASTTTANIDFNVDGQIDPETETGWYIIDNIEPNLDGRSYTLREVIPADWFQSQPGSDYTISLESGDSPDDLDFGNYQTGTISGRKFHDRDTDGQRSATEEYLVGWTIVLVDENGNDVQSVETASFDLNFDGTIDVETETGWYFFEEVVPGNYTIREEPRSGWVQTAPVSGTHSLTLSSGEELTDYDFGNFVPAIISGRKFHDVDADGTRDASEPYLNGWTIELLDASDGSLLATTTTADYDANNDGTISADEIGWYRFDGLFAGEYIIQEVLEADWYQSAPANGTHVTSVVSEQVVSDNDFGNYQTGTISGRKWNDMNADGIKDASEPYLNGWTIELIDAGGNVLGSAVTAEQNGEPGWYTITDVHPGTYRLREVPQAGWTPSAPVDGVHQDVTIVSQQDLTGYDFANFQSITLTGVKYHDLNANFIQESGEPVLPNWEFELLNAAGQVIETTLTDDFGMYRFEGLRPGEYTVREVQQDGWNLSQPVDGSYTVDLLGGESAEDLDFGNFQYTSVAGRKWNDLDGDGTRDSNEPYLNGWTIELVDANGNVVQTDTTTGNDMNGDGVFDPETETGWYNFTTIRPGEYTIREVDQAGWLQTVPSTGSYAVTMISGQANPDYDFANFEPAVIRGQKFNDLNANGQFDLGEPPLAGWTIELVDVASGNVIETSVTGDVDLNGDGQIDPVTEAGIYVFDELPVFEFIVREVNQTNWIQSLPAAGVDVYQDEIVPGTELVLNFGNYQGTELSGRKWNDLNGNGLIDAGEPYLNGWTIELINSQGNIVETMTTMDMDLNNDGQIDPATEIGWYRFTALKPGQWFVREQLQDGWVGTAPNGGTLAEAAYNLDQNLELKFTGNFHEDEHGLGEKWVASEITGEFVWYFITPAGQVFEWDRVAGSGAGELIATFDPRYHANPELLYDAQPPSLQPFVLNSGDVLDDVDFGNFEYSSITGRKYIDANENGIFDSGEEWANGWEIQLLDGNGNVLGNTMTTDIDLNGDGSIDPATETGVYQFENLVPGEFAIREVIPRGWRQTTPRTESVATEAFELDNLVDLRFTGNLHQNAYGSDERWLLATVPEEQWYFILPNGDLFEWDNVIPQDGAIPSGRFVTSLGADYYNDPELLHEAANPNVHSLTVISGSDTAGLNFGNAEIPGTIRGRIYLDDDGSDVRTTDEPWYNGWVVELLDETGTVIASTTSADMDLNADGAINPETESGWFEFTGLTDVNYTVRAQPAADWATGEADVMFSETRVAPQVEIPIGEHGTVAGQKFHDLNGNAVRDADEPTLNGWTIHLVDQAGNIVATEVTADVDLNNDGEIDPTTETGVYQFLGIDPGIYTITEDVQDGWVQSAPNNDSLALQASEFDARVNLAVGESLFQDWGGLNERWMFDSAGNWYYIVPTGELYLWDTTSSPQALNGTLVDTYSNLYYEAPQLLTDPISSLIELNSAEVIEDLDVGNYQPATIEGRVWHDSNLNGVYDEGENYLNDWTIQLTDSQGRVITSQLTGDIDLNNDGEIDPATESGWYQFTDLRPGQYSVQQIINPGWLQSEPGFGPDADAVWRVDQDLQLAGSADQFQNWGDRNERWLFSATEANPDTPAKWFYMTPDGSIYEWDGVSGSTDRVEGTLVAEVDPLYYENLSLLFAAKDPRVTIASGETLADLNFGDYNSTDSAFSNLGGLLD